MPYAGLLPSQAAIRQAWHAPLEIVPRSHREFAEVIFCRAREIEREWAWVARQQKEGATTACKSTAKRV